MASLAAEHRLQARGLQWLWLLGSRAQAQQLWHTGLVALGHVGSSRTRDRTCVSCIGRWTPNHCATREVPFLQFLSKNKRHFSFSPRTLLNNIFTVLFYYLLPFFRQIHNSIFPKFFIFLSKKLFQVPFTVFQRIEIFSIKRIL